MLNLPMLAKIMIIVWAMATPALAAETAPSRGGETVLLSEKDFRPTKAEKAFFNKGGAQGGAAAVEGLFTNARGFSAYLTLEEGPVNFYWTGSSRQGLLNGQPVRLIHGQGEMTVKGADDDLIIQRYKGSVKNGLWHGHGELLGREAYHGNAYFYRGDFVHGRMEGRGVYINNELIARGGLPFIYEGEFMDDTFHGQGVMTDLTTGEVIHSGFWLEGFPFQGGAKSWQKANRQAGVLYTQRRYTDPRITELAGAAGPDGTVFPTAESAGEATR